MKQSIGYTVSINIVVVFIVITFAFIGGAITYYKAFKINNIIADSIEKYEGYNSLSKAEIDQKLSSLGYNMSSVDCNKQKVQGIESKVKSINEKNNFVDKGDGYCVYYGVSKCFDDASPGANTYCEAEEYNYVIKTFLRFNLPIVNVWLKFPVYTKTNSIYACYGNNC